MSPLRKGVLLSLGSALCAALFLIPFKAAGAGEAREAVVLVMLLCAALLNTVTSVSRRGVRLGVDRITVIAAVSLAVATALGNFAVGEALARLDPGMTSVLQQTQVLFVAGAAHVFLGERITGRYLVGAALALAGFAVIHVPGAGDVRGAGVLWAVASAVCFGSMHVVTRRVIDRIDPVWVNALRLWLAVAVMAAIPGTVGRAAGLGGGTWLACAAAAFAGPFLGRVCIMYAVKFVPASVSALIVLLSPVFAFALAYLVFGTVPRATEVAGAAVIMAGVALPLAALAARRPAPVGPAVGSGDEPDDADRAE